MPQRDSGRWKTLIFTLAKMALKKQLESIDYTFFLYTLWQRIIRLQWEQFTENKTNQA